VSKLSKLERNHGKSFYCIRPLTKVDNVAAVSTIAENSFFGALHFNLKLQMVLQHDIDANLDIPDTILIGGSKTYL
jgi:hypothetical protein